MLDACPGSQKFKKPEPENVRCPFCGAEAEIWTDEFSTVCPSCAKTVMRPGGQCCLDWCKMAKECVGEKLYNEYLKSKINK